MTKYILLWMLMITLSIISCKKEATQNLSNYHFVIDSIKQEYAPDKRIAIFDIKIDKKGTNVVLKGQSDQTKAVQILKNKLNNIGLTFTDSIAILPDTSIGNTKYAVVNNSVANIRSKAKHAGELATQVLLGTSLKVLKIDGDFYLVQSPDQYISWVDHGGVVLMDSTAYNNWSKSPKIIFTNIYGFSYQKANENSDSVSDLVLGDQLIFLGEENDFYKVAYPDKRIAYIKKTESAIYSQWLKTVQPSGDLIESYARSLLGTPYLWGGTSTKGMDCSGFTKTVYLMNGFIIPRDASQQVLAGKNIDPNLKFENLQKGDLLFFGKKATPTKKQRVTHVGIWLDNGVFIHASKQVRLSSIDQNSTIYDAKNTHRYLGSRRYLGVDNTLIIKLN